MAIVRTKLQWILLLIGLVLLFTFPLWGPPRYVSLMITMGVSVIGVLGLTLLTGYAGQLSLGHMAFVAVGAYTTGILISELSFSFWAALPCAGLVAGIIGIIFGLPSLRVRGFYLVIATLAAQFIIMHVIIHTPSLTGGTAGLQIPSVKIGDFAFKSNLSYYLLTMVFVVICVMLAKNMARTRVGRAWIAIRDNDLSAEVMGVNLLAYKLLAFFVGCFFAGIAGALLAPYLRAIVPESFGLMGSVWYLGYIIIGGMGSIMGPICGVVFITLLQEFTGDLVTTLATNIPTLGGFVTASGYLVFGLVIILFLIFEPRGIAHRWDLFKAWYRLWPFSQ